MRVCESGRVNMSLVLTSPLALQRFLHYHYYDKRMFIFLANLLDLQLPHLGTRPYTFPFIHKQEKRYSGSTWNENENEELFVLHLGILGAQRKSSPPVD